MMTRRLLPSSVRISCRFSQVAHKLENSTIREMGTLNTWTGSLVNFY